MANATLKFTETQQQLIDEVLRSEHDAAGYKLELIKGVGIWEASPVYSHQKKVLEVILSIKQLQQDAGSCKCVSVPGLTLLFPDGSIKRPDISIYCREPVERDSACTLKPEVVIEIISRGYERKDTEISLNFYLDNRIDDIVIFNPVKESVNHYQDGKVHEYTSPVELTFLCGCKATL